MNLLKCANGHFYDADKYVSCPHCEQMERQDLTVTIPADSPEPRSGADLTVTEPLTDFVKTTDITDLTWSGGPGGNSNEKDEVTVGYYQNLLQKEPVVGFLVCTKGEYFGDSFSLKSGRNFIGRAATMDVVLDMDAAVSRERHAIIVYEPRSRVFYAQNGDSHGMFYVNDKVVLSNEVLKVYDKISLGNTELMFIPCCGPEFCWEDCENKPTC